MVYNGCLAFFGIYRREQNVRQIFETKRHISSLGYLALCSRICADFVARIIHKRKYLDLNIMVTKHFFKMLIIFSGMIILGLIGIFAVAQLEKENSQIETSSPAN